MQTQLLKGPGTGRSCQRRGVEVEGQDTIASAFGDDPQGSPVAQVPPCLKDTSQNTERVRLLT